MDDERVGRGMNILTELFRTQNKILERIAASLEGADEEAMLNKAIAERAETGEPQCEESGPYGRCLRKAGHIGAHIAKLQSVEELERALDSA
jgi:hypothetical protein